MYKQDAQVSLRQAHYCFVKFLPVCVYKGKTDNKLHESLESDFHIYFKTMHIVIFILLN